MEGGNGYPLPLPDGDHAHVTLAFEHEGKQWTLEKRWGAAQMSRLSDGTTAIADPAAVQKAIDDAKTELARTAQSLTQPASGSAGRPPIVPPGTARKQASVKCGLPEFNRLSAEFAKGHPRYTLPSGQPDRAHMLYTLHAVGFPVLTDSNLEPAFEAMALHAAGLPVGPAEPAGEGLPF
jgi:hypothetical protein